MPKVILYVATSFDGFIADQDGGVDWLPPAEDDPDDIFGYQALLARTSSIAMGSRSYQQILGFGAWAWPDKQSYVFTTKALTTTRTDITFVQDSPTTFITTLENRLADSGDIWLLGGAQLIKSFAQAALIDECIITIIPTTLKQGIRLELPYADFTLVTDKACPNNIIQKTYMRQKPCTKN
jgi:dihydrofolate reductase